MIITGSIIISCHKRSDNPAPAQTCYQESETLKGITIDSFSYNPNNQLISLTQYDSTSKKKTVITASFSYNSNGKISKITTNSTLGVLINKYYYNSSGQLIYETDSAKSTVFTGKTDSIIYKYSGANIIEEIDYSFYNKDTVFYLYTYDNNGNVKTEKDSLGGAVTDIYSYAYDTDNILFSQLVINSNLGGAGAIDLAYLNGKNNVTSMTHTRSGVYQSDSYTASYTYNSNGYATAKSFTAKGNIYNSVYNLTCK